MTVAAILAEKGRDVVTIGPEATLSEALAVLAEHSIGAVMVAGSDRQVLGILSERDVVRAIARQGVDVLNREAQGFMTREVVTCREADTIVEVMEAMTTGRFRHVPVVEDGRLVGIISIGDAVKRRIDQVEMEAEELRSYITAAS